MAESVPESNDGRAFRNEQVERRRHASDGQIYSDER